MFVSCLPRLDVGDGRGHQVGVVGQPRFAAGRKDLVGFAVGGNAPPDRAVDDDRRGDRLAEALGQVLSRECARNFRPVVDSGRPAGRHRQRSFGTVRHRPGSSVRHWGSLTVRPEDLGEHRRVLVVVDEADGAHTKYPGRLDGDCGEHGLGFGALRDQRRDPSQRP